jgi:hypothetical protein
MGGTSVKVVRLEQAGQEVLARAGNILVARAFDMCVSLYQEAEIELRQASRVIRSSKSRLKLRIFTCGIFFRPLLDRLLQSLHLEQRYL